MNLSNLHILLADDDVDDCLFFQEILEELPFSTHFTAVSNGELLMQLLLKESYALPDVIFLDLNMPRKNGFECLMEIKRNLKLKHLIVVIYSTSFEQNMFNQLYKNGAHYYIQKPREYEKLKQIIEQALTLVTTPDNAQPGIDYFLLNADAKPTKT